MKSKENKRIQLLTAVNGYESRHSWARAMKKFDWQPGTGEMVWYEKGKTRKGPNWTYVKMLFCCCQSCLLQCKLPKSRDCRIFYVHRVPSTTGPQAGGELQALPEYKNNNLAALNSVPNPLSSLHMPNFSQVFPSRNYGADLYGISHMLFNLASLAPQTTQVLLKCKKGTHTRVPPNQHVSEVSTTHSG